MKKTNKQQLFLDVFCIYLVSTFLCFICDLATAAASFDFLNQHFQFQIDNWHFEGKKDADVAADEIKSDTYFDHHLFFNMPVQTKPELQDFIISVHLSNIYFFKPVSMSCNNC